MTPRKRGRPPLVEGQAASRVHVKLPPDLHDRACVRALRQKVSVSQVIRTALERLLNEPTGGDQSPA